MSASRNSPTRPPNSPRRSGRSGSKASWQSLDATDPRLDELWVAEGEDRLAAYQRGEIDAHDFDEALDKYRLEAKRRTIRMPGVLWARD